MPAGSLRVSTAGIVGVALIFATEPAVVHHEQLSAHAGDVGHHLLHAFLVDIEIHSFPAVQQNFAQAGAVSQPVVASPAVEVAANAANPVFAVAQRQWRSNESLAFAEVVGRVVVVDSGEEVVIVGIVGVEPQFVVAGVADGCADCASGVLVSLAVERYHHFAVRGVGVSCAVGVLYHFNAVGQWSLLHTCLVGPRAVQLRHMYVGAADRQIAGHETRELYGAFLVAGYLSPCLYNILSGVCTVFNVDVEGINLVGHAHGGDFCAVGVSFFRYAGNVHHSGHIAVGVDCREGFFLVWVVAVHGVCVEARSACGAEIRDVGIRKGVAVVQEFERLALCCVQHKRTAGGADVDIFGT